MRKIIKRHILSSQDRGYRLKAFKWIFAIILFSNSIFTYAILSSDETSRYYLLIWLSIIFILVVHISDIIHMKKAAK